MTRRRRAWSLVCGLLLLVACARPDAVPTVTPSAVGTGAAATTPSRPPARAATGAPDPRATVEAPGVAPRPDGRRVPLAPAPGGLGTARFPQDATGVAALFARLPPAIVGLPRVPQFDSAGPERLVAGYGERPGGAPGPRLAVQAVSIPNSGFYPANWGAGEVIAAQHERGALPPGTPLPCGARAGEATPGGARRVVVGRADALFWSREDTVVASADAPGRTPLCTIQWGVEASPYLYGVGADSQEGLDAALAAVVDTARAAAPGTIAPAFGSRAARPSPPARIVRRPGSPRHQGARRGATAWRTVAT